MGQKMKVLFLCKTAYQIMVAERIKETFYSDAYCDIVIFDIISNYSDISEQIKQSKSFRCVISYKCREYRKLKGLKRLIIQSIYRANKFSCDTYDAVYIANSYDYIENKIIKNIKKDNKQLKAYMFEDGFSTYSNHYGDFFSMLYNSKGILHLYYKIIYMVGFVAFIVYLIGFCMQTRKPIFLMLILCILAYTNGLYMYVDFVLCIPLLLVFYRKIYGSRHKILPKRKVE